MKTLQLFRHAKSERSGSSAEEDFDRRLNERGQRDAPNMGAEIAARELFPDLVLVSAALRTRETWELAAPHFAGRPPLVEIIRELYLAPAKKILATVASTGERFDRVMVVGHNPGLHELALRLADKAKSRTNQEALDRLKSKFPTAAFAELSFEADNWNGVSASSGALTHFLSPKMVAGDSD